MIAGQPRAWASSWANVVLPVPGARLEYWGYAVKGTNVQKFTVIVQYARKTADGRYDAGNGQKIGVITAYCNGKAKCPTWMNE